MARYKGLFIKKCIYIYTICNIYDSLPLAEIMVVLYSVSDDDFHQLVHEDGALSFVTTIVAYQVLQGHKFFPAC